VRRAAILLALLALAGCGGQRSPSAASVARAWSAALDQNDNEAAARLFADDARIVQGGELVLRDHAAAVQWNAMLPCGGVIESVIPQSKTDVLVVFRLGERPQHRCDGPGTRTAALFRVQGGKIVLWHQTQAPPLGETPGGEVA
jgi:limonene-1,2-epoxide hydrolase